MICFIAWGRPIHSVENSLIHSFTAKLMFSANMTTNTDRALWTNHSHFLLIYYNTSLVLNSTIATNSSYLLCTWELLYTLRHLLSELMQSYGALNLIWILWFFYRTNTDYNAVDQRCDLSLNFVYRVCACIYLIFFVYVSICI